MFKSYRIYGMLVALVTALLTGLPAMAWPPGGNGGGNGGGGNQDPPPSNFPPFSYAVATILVEGMGIHHDTNDDGVSAISVRPDYVSNHIATSHNSAAALLYPDGSVDYLDNLISPDLPDDLAAAIDINNSGQVLAIGWTDDGSERYRGFLLTPNPDAAADGYAYDVVLLPLPDWGVEVHFPSMRLNEAGDVLYLVRGASTGGTTVQAERYVRLSNGDIVELGPQSLDFNVVEVNSWGTLLVQSYDGNTDTDYLIEADGTTIVPENLQGSPYWEIHDLAENGYSCGVQRQIAGQKKIKGQWVTQYRDAPVLYDPAGNAAFAAFSEVIELAYNQRLVLNEQLIGAEPVIASQGGLWLSYPGYDAVYFEQLMDDANRAAFRSLFPWDNPADSYFLITTPRLPNGDVDHTGAPSFYGELGRVWYDNGQAGSTGVYVVYPIPQ